MPSLIHQIDKDDSPPAPTVANGVPLSVRSRAGRPYSRNVASNSGRTCLASVPCCMPWQRNTIRLYASEIVSGSQRTPSAVRNQPLKSAHHVSLGSPTEPNGCVRGGTWARGGRRGTVSPARVRMAPRVLATGQRCWMLCSSSGSGLSFLGPQLGWRALARSTAAHTSSAMALG